MMPSVTIYCPMPPSMNRWHRNPEALRRVLIDKEVKAYRMRFNRVVPQMNPSLIKVSEALTDKTGAYFFQVDFYFKRIFKKNPKPGESPFLDLDVDKRLGILSDAMRDLLEISDANTVTWSASKWECETGFCARELAVLEIQRVSTDRRASRNPNIGRIPESLRTAAAG